MTRHCGPTMLANNDVSCVADLSNNTAITTIQPRYKMIKTPKKSDYFRKLQLEDNDNDFYEKKCQYLHVAHKTLT